MINKGMLTSNSNIWETPQELFDKLNNKYHFEIDVCALPENTKLPNYFTPKINGLSQDWNRYKACWMNPPYGSEISKWVEKAYNESQKGALVVALLPARTDTRWFHNWIYKIPGVEVEFIKGRLKFSGNKWNAPFPNMIVIFNSTNT